MQGRTLSTITTSTMLALAACTLDAEPTDGLSEQAAGLELFDELADASGEHAQMPGFDLFIAKDGPNIALSWSDQGAQEYEVWTSAEPYFEPGDASSMLLAGGLAGASYDHVGGNDDVERYYRVVAVGGMEPVSTTVGKITQALAPGYTKLGQCLIPEIDTSIELVTDMGTNPISTHMWDAATQSWDWAWAYEDPGLSFGVGEVVTVHHPLGGPVSPDSYTMVGHVPVEGDASIPLLPGDNLVTSLPFRYGEIMASALLATVDGGQRVGIWDAASQATTWYPDDGDFVVPRCSPIHVDVDAPSLWPPPAPEPLVVSASPSCTNYEGMPVPLEANASGGTGLYTYTWTPDDGTLTTTDQAATLASPVGIQSYMVTVDDGVEQASDTVVVVDNNPFDLQNNCTLYQGNMGGAPASISYDMAGTRACELGNNGFGLHLCEGVVFEDTRLVGQLEVLAGTGDDDMLGLVWGAQDNTHFYSLAWKRGTQSLGSCVSPAGIIVKRVEADSLATMTAGDVYCPIDTDGSELLLTPAEVTTEGWVAGQSYTVTIDFRQTGSDISVVRDSDGVVMATASISDTTFTSGYFGSTTFSQTNACVGPLFASCL